MGRDLAVDDCVVGSVALLRFECFKEVVDGAGLGWLGWLGWLYSGWSLLLLFCWSPGWVAVAIAGSISDVGALASVLISALVAERTLLVDAAAPFSFVLSNVVPFVCVAQPKPQPERRAFHRVLNKHIERLKFE